jgi:hypothetical protein
MPKLENTLERLALTFTARDIMVPKEKLLCAPDGTSALRVLDENPDFDVIPIKQKGMISAYIRRNCESITRIQLPEIISDATSILDLVDSLRDREFVFVLSNRCIAGYVHFSDLNNHVVKLPFFAILEALESHLVNKVGPLINGSNLKEVLDKQRVEILTKRMRDMSESRANLGWVNLLSFNEIVLFASRFEKVFLEQKQVEMISKVRNLVCHADSMLVEAHNDVRRLVETKKICFSILSCTKREN